MILKNFRTCEITLEILRQNESTLSTILEVLLYDPLYAWTISTEKAYRHQRDEEVAGSTNGGSNDYAEDEDRNLTANRALLRVQAKLKGQANENTGYSSIEGQVENLIQQATNPALLSRLFCGWKPFL